MARDQLKRFNRWQQRLPKNARYFTDLVVDEIVPMFRERGFDRFPDYAGGNAYAIGPNCIPLQRRSGLEWPTAEILFDKRNRPSLGITFATLPEICCRQELRGPRKISRLEANVVEGRGYFLLCKRLRRNFDCNFGYGWFALRPKAKLDREIGTLKSLLPWLFSVLETGIPEKWYERTSYVDQHAFQGKAPHIPRIN